MRMSAANSVRGRIAILAMLAAPVGLLLARAADPNEVPAHPFAGLAQVLPAPATDANGLGISYTYQRPTGNRLISGRASLPVAQVVDVPLPDEPQWVVGYPVGSSSLWVVVLADGQVQAFLLTGDAVESLPLESLPYPILSPPALAVVEESIQLMLPPVPGDPLLTHPVLLNRPDLAFASINGGGDLVVWEHGRVTRLLVDALTDSRLITDDAGRILVMTNPSTRYTHGILGDSLEPTGIALVETLPCPRVKTTISSPSPQVIEGLSPIWADLDGDGSQEIIVTVSDATEGAQLVAYSENGQLRAAGPSIGRGYRWRHQLAVAPFGPEGETEIATVLTPHIGGVVEFFRLVEDRLDIVARVPGYSTHVIRSRNLDMALAADLDSDGRIELLVPNQQFNTLGAIRRTADNAEVAWTIPVGGRLTTNIASVRFADDTVAVAAGNATGTLHIWLP